MDLILYTKGEFTVSLLPSFVFALSRRLLICVRFQPRHVKTRVLTSQRRNWKTW